MKKEKQFSIRQMKNIRSFPEVSSLVRKYLGLDKVVENIVNQIGEIKYAFIIGDYADGKDTGTINLVIVGAVDSAKLKYWVHKTETIISRKVTDRYFE
jgi:hypothetical protein